jgi:hypothetical protein
MSNVIGITREKLAARSAYVYHYTVSGTYGFPIDMLRYDEAWPNSEIDSALIVQTANHNSAEAPQIRIVGLRSPTVARWESFGWKVL